VSYGRAFRFICLTNDPDLAAAADNAGIERVGLDIERLGKSERQGHLPHLRISQHRLQELPRLRAILHRARLFLRCNHLHDGSAEEIEQALDAGVDDLMLPYFHSPTDVETFVGLVRGRAHVLLLLETPAAVTRIQEIVAVPGVDEVIVGLNDLKEAFQLSHPFELLTLKLMDAVATTVRAAGLPFGVGGLADPNHDALPVDPKLVYPQCVRLGATSAFIARQFTERGLRPEGLQDAVFRCRAELDRWGKCGPAGLEEARCELERATRDLSPQL
jgi:hypothetical protein